MIGEPQRNPYDLNFTLFGFPVRISPWFWAVALMLSLGGGADDMRTLLLNYTAWASALLISILVHELGHAFMQRHYGFTPSIVLYGFGGLAIPGHHRGGRQPDSMGNILISLAGPFAGFGLVAVILILLTLFGPGFELLLGVGYGFAIIPKGSVVPHFFGQILSHFFFYLTYSILFISGLWGLVNLLPIYPLDGGHVCREICLRISRHEGIRWSLLISVCLGGIIAAWGFMTWIKDGGDGFPFIAILFGYLAYSSYQILQRYNFPR